MDRSLVLDTAAAGAGATALTTATILCLGLDRDASAWAPLNAVSHMPFGDEAAWHEELSAKYTATGIALHSSAMFMWAGAYAGLMQRLPKQNLPTAIGAGVAVSALAYVTDYYVVPRRLTPGFEKRLSGQSIFWIFSALAVGLAAGWSMRARPR